WLPRTFRSLKGNRWQRGLLAVERMKGRSFRPRALAALVQRGEAGGPEAVEVEYPRHPGGAPVLRRPVPGAPRALTLYYARVAPATVTALLHDRHLSGLRELELDILWECGEAAVEAVASAPHLRHLTSLTLHLVSIKPAQARSLAGAAHLAGLRRL